MKANFRNDLAFALHIIKYVIKYATHGKKIYEAFIFTSQHKSVISLGSAEVHGTEKSACDLLRSTENLL